MKITGPNPLITFGPHNGSSRLNAEIELATYDTESHLNIWFRDKARGVSYCLCASPKQVAKLRDELLKLYPVDNSGIINAAKNVSYAEGYRDGLADQPVPTPTKSKWEVVTDGLDRCKVEGGYIYQNDGGVMTFVPSNTDTCVDRACVYRKKD